MSRENCWRRCSNCKSEIDFETTYWVCSVSTCNRKRTGLVFCSVSCWDAHLPVMRHREAWAEERTSPDTASWQRDSDSAANQVASAKRETAPRRARVRREVAPSPTTGNPEVPHDVLIVASKLKSYIRERSGMNTSDRVMAALSDQVRALCDRAIERARRDERKTVLDRDIPQV